MEALYYYKDARDRNIPILHEVGSKEVILSNIQDKMILEKIQKDFPQTRGNLFVLIERTEFFLTP